MKSVRLMILGVIGVFLLGAPSLAIAQSGTTGAFAGVVRDATGGVLPGVTVEAASPALIEKVRIAVTDSQGQYKIFDLRPGTYDVTFTLTGFSIFRREGIELSTGFTMTANADLAIGGLEETIVVSGASAVVDVHDTRSSNVLTRTQIDALPTNKSTSGFAALTLGAIGAVQDVGGNTGEAPTSFGVHGTSGGQGKHLMDGMPMNGLLFGSSLGTRLNFVNQLAIEEVSMTTRGGSAETETGGPQINYIPKEGSNTFSFIAAATAANENMQSSKLTDTLKARNVTSAPGLKRLHDVGAGFGGPIAQDRMWFYLSTRWWDTETYAPGMYFQDKTAPAARGGLIWVPNLNRPAYSRSPNKDGTIRMTWQATERNKFVISENIQYNCFCFQGVSLGQAPTATVDIFGNSSMTQVTWSHPRSNRLLFEGGFTGLYQTQHPSRPENVSTTDIAVQDTGLGLAYNARAFSAGNQFFYGGAGLAGDTLAYVTDVNFSQINARGSASYVTGSHAFKAGFYMQKGWQGGFYKFNDPPLRYGLINGTPATVTQWADPVSYRSNLKLNLGIFLQDQWTFRRVTMNLGLRYDSVNAENPAHSTPAGLFIGERNFPAVSNVPDFKDISPRVGIAWDVRGDGRTAVKAQLGRYVDTETTSIAALNHPSYAIVTNVTRTWADANDNLVPDCNLHSPAANGECGPTPGVLGSNTIVRQWADDAKAGFGNRGYSWQGSISFQHELTDNVSVQAGYYRTWQGNFRVVDNNLIGQADFDEYSVTIPTNQYLGSASGTQATGLYDIKPASFPLFNATVTQAGRFGKQSAVYNGFDLAVNTRFGQGGFMQGGVSSGQTVNNSCYVIDNPAQRFCETTLPFSRQTQLKFNGSYPLPAGIQLSGVFQNMPGPTYGANGIFFFGQGMNRGFSGGYAFLPMVEPNTLHEDRFTQVDLRVAKIFRIGDSGRVRIDFDLFNLFNSRAILGVNSTYGVVFSPTQAPGAGWRMPSSVLGGRMFRFGGQVDF